MAIIVSRTQMQLGWDDPKSWEYRETVQELEDYGRVFFAHEGNANIFAMTYTEQTGRAPRGEAQPRGSLGGQARQQRGERIMIGPDWSKLTNDEIAIIRKIVDRALPIFREARVRIDRMALEMDVSAAHLVCPLRLVALLEADDFNFMHDVGGIVRNLNRRTFQLDNCFAQPYVLVEGGTERVPASVEG